MEKQTTTDTQAEEIRERVKEFWDNPQEYTLTEFEDMFEDRDPFEFL